MQKNNSLKSRLKKLKNKKNGILNAILDGTIGFHATVRKGASPVTPETAAKILRDNIDRLDNPKYNIDLSEIFDCATNKHLGQDKV